MNVVKEMTVEGAGRREINGTYQRCGEHDGVSKYIKPSSFDGQSVDFLLFRCKLTDGTSRWYISFVPKNTHPGTTQDIDFYAASLSPGVVDHSIPPRDGWIAIPSNGGASPAPTVYPKESNYRGCGQNDITDDVTLIGVKSPTDIVSEKVEAAKGRGDIISIDDDDGDIKTTENTENTTGLSRPEGILMPVGFDEYDEGKGNDYDLQSGEPSVWRETKKSTCFKVDATKPNESEAMNSCAQRLTQMWLLIARDACEVCGKKHSKLDDVLFECSSCRKCIHQSCLEHCYNIVQDDTNENLMCPSCKHIKGNIEICDDESDYCEDE